MQHSSRPGLLVTLQCVLDYFLSLLLGSVSCVSLGFCFGLYLSVLVWFGFAFDFLRLLDALPVMKKTYILIRAGAKQNSKTLT
jgi:hypothetical protein